MRLSVADTGVGIPAEFAAAVAAFVREYGITHSVRGRSLRPWYRRWFGPSPLDRLLRAVRSVDVIVVDTL